MLDRLLDDPFGITDETDHAKRKTLGTLGAAGVTMATSGCMGMDALYQSRVKDQINEDLDGKDAEETVSYFLNEQRSYENDEGASVTYGSFDVELTEDDDGYTVTVTGDTPFTIDENGLVAVREDTGERVDEDQLVADYASIASSIYETVYEVCEEGKPVARGQYIDTSDASEELGGKHGTYELSFVMDDHVITGEFSDHDALYEDADNQLFGSTAPFSDRLSLEEL